MLCVNLGYDEVLPTSISLAVEPTISTELDPGAQHGRKVLRNDLSIIRFRTIPHVIDEITKRFNMRLEHFGEVILE